MDSIDMADRLHRKKMQDGSRLLADCINRARAGLETFAPAGLPRGTGLWSPADLIELRQLHSEGLTEGQIAVKMGRETPQVNHAIQCYIRGRK